MPDPQRWRWPLVALLAALILGSYWWLAPFLDWLQVNADQVQGLESFVQLLLFVLMFLTALARPRQDSPAALARAEAKDREDLGSLRQRVRWEVGKRIENSLFEEVRIALDRRPEPAAVATTPWARELEWPGAEPEPLPAERSTTAVFDDDAVGALLILGEPGAGKTVELLHLAQDLLGRDGPDEPVPVMLNLSSWASAGLPLVDWIARELKLRHEIPPATARDWVARERLLLLLDGLDEVTEPKRAACAEAINAFRDQHGLTRLAVCCRSAEYRALPALRLGTAVRLLPLARGQVERYLIDAGPALAGLRQALAEDPPLAALAETPLMLNVMSLT